MEYLKAFVIGSSPLTWVPFVLAVRRMRDRNFSLENYPIKAALYFGAMNMISLFLARQFGWPNQTRFAVISLLSALLVSVWISVRQAWTFPGSSPPFGRRWLLQYLLLLISHAFTFLVAIQGLTHLFK
jgi:hypothetical protein